MGELTKLENELVELEGIKLTRGQVELIKRTIFIGAEDDEMRLFFYECRRRGVHPMDRLIYPVVRKDKEGKRHVTFQMGIDYLRAAGEETGRYVGQDPPVYGPLIKQDAEEWDEKLGQMKPVTIEVPEWAEVTIKRKDPETGEVTSIPHMTYWKEYYPGQKLGHMWRKMPHNQLAKCAEAGALRKAFPRKLGGLYINEELEQAEAVPFAPIAMPQEKKPPEGPKEQGEIIVSLVDKVTQTEGKKKDGTEWVKYAIHVGEKKYSTFSKTFAEEAKQASLRGVPARIEFKPTPYGPEILHLQIEEPPREPGDE